MSRVNALQNLDLNNPIFITGHTGFKGAWLTHILILASFEIVGMSWNRNASFLCNESTTKPEREFILTLQIPQRLTK